MNPTNNKSENFKLLMDELRSVKKYMEVMDENFKDITGNLRDNNDTVDGVIAELQNVNASLFNLDSRAIGKINTLIWNLRLPLAVLLATTSKTSCI